MRFVLLIGLFAFCLPEAKASKRELTICRDLIADIKPEFEPALQLDSTNLRVKYRDVIFQLTMNEFRILQLIVMAPNEVITNDDLIRGVWGLDEPGDALGSLRATTSYLRGKFKYVEPRFVKLKPKHGIGMYWERDSHDKIQIGRIGVARFIYEGYADGHKISLGRQEHEVLKALLKRPSITVSNIPELNAVTMSVVMSHLNRKFRDILGEPVAIPGPHGLASYRLSKTFRLSDVDPGYRGWLADGDDLVGKRSAANSVWQ